jgi:membrane protein
LRDIWRNSNQDKVMRLASGIAFSAIFSIAPLLIVLIAIVGGLVGIQNGGHGHHVAEDALLSQIRAAAGKDAADAVGQLVTASFNKPRAGLLAQVIGWIAFVFGAMGLFASLQDALNTIWRIESTGGGWRQMLRDRLSAFAMILVVGALLLLTVVVNAGLSFATAHPALVPFLGSPVVALVSAPLVSFALVTLALALVYKVLPDVTLDWRDVWIGATVTAVLFVAGEVAIAWYLGVAGVASAYGAAGSLLAALLWIYYSAVVLLVGVEFTKVLAGAVATTAPTTLRLMSEQPAGIDPRTAGHEGG